MDFDPGPPQRFARIFARLPDLAPIRRALWFDWGPIFYRGRLDGSARILCVASDPGPTERIAGRTLVGDAGQRVQGFLAKLGLSRSYLCLNAFPYALFPSWAMAAPRLLALPEFAEWRNDLYDRAADGIEVVVAFGGVARSAMEQWPGAHDRHLIELPHPSSREPSKLIAAWKGAVPGLRSRVAPDPGTVPTPNYGTRFREEDYAPIPSRDLPFGVPPWVGDNAWSRAGTPRRNNSVKRPEPDDRHTLIWTAPTTQP